MHIRGLPTASIESMSAELTDEAGMKVGASPWHGDVESSVSTYQTLPGVTLAEFLGRRLHIVSSIVSCLA